MRIFLAKSFISIGIEGAGRIENAHALDPSIASIVPLFMRVMKPTRLDDSEAFVFVAAAGEIQSVIAPTLACKHDSSKQFARNSLSGQGRFLSFA